MSRRGENADHVLSSSLLRVRGSGARVLTNSFVSKQCSVTRCARGRDDLFCRFVISINGFKVFPSASMDLFPRLGEPNDSKILTFRDENLELGLKFDDGSVFELWQTILSEAVATARCQEAFTTFSISGRLSFYRLNRALIQCAGLVSYEHPCMSRGRFLLTARRQLSELLLRFRDAGVAFTTRSEVSSLLNYCHQDSQLAQDSDVTLLERVMSLVPQPQAGFASHSGTIDATVKAADEAVELLLQGAALDELEDEQNGLFAYNEDGSLVSTPTNTNTDTNTLADSNTETGDNRLLAEKLSAMRGPLPVTIPLSNTAATRQFSATGPVTEDGMQGVSTEFSPIRFHLDDGAEQQQQQLDHQVADDFALAMAVQIAYSEADPSDPEGCLSPLVTAHACVLREGSSPTVAARRAVSTGTGLTGRPERNPSVLSLKHTHGQRPSPVSVLQSPAIEADQLPSGASLSLPASPPPITPGASCASPKVCCSPGDSLSFSSALNAIASKQPEAAARGLMGAGLLCLLLALLVRLAFLSSPSGKIAGFSPAERMFGTVRDHFLPINIVKRKTPVPQKQHVGSSSTPHTYTWASPVSDPGLRNVPYASKISSPTHRPAADTNRNSDFDVTPRADYTSSQESSFVSLWKKGFFRQFRHWIGLVLKPLSWLFPFGVDVKSQKSNAKKQSRVDTVKVFGKESLLFF